MSGPAVAQIGYSKDFIEAGNPGGLGMCDIIGSGCSTDSQCADGALECLEPSLKTFEDTWTMNPGETVDVDIWLTDVPEDLLTGGFFISYDPALVNITNVVPYDSDNGGPWDASFTNSFEIEPGQWFLVLANFNCVSPDADGDIILGTVTFQCQGSGNADIINVTIANFETVVACSGTGYDIQIAPNIVTIIQTCSIDAECNDGVACTDDACVSEVCENIPSDASCPDDGLYCTGFEVCDPDNGCISTGDPCTPFEVCDDELDQCVAEPCTIAIKPSFAAIFTWETVQFSATVDGACNAPCYTWEIAAGGCTGNTTGSNIGSTIDANGLYMPGDMAGTDVVRAIDKCNGNICDSATVQVMVTTTTTTIPCVPDSYEPDDFPPDEVSTSIRLSSHSIPNLLFCSFVFGLAEKENETLYVAPGIVTIS
jgi:hypothetical protein